MADLENKEQRIIEATEKLETDIIDLAGRLVAEPSTRGEEASVLQVMEAELKKLGFDSKKVAIDPQKLKDHPGFAPVPWDYDNRYNVVGYRPADQEGGSSLMLNGHLDVVNPGCLDFWENDPFSPIIKDGWLYGRGAGDMKSGVAAMTYAVHAVEKAGFGFKAFHQFRRVLGQFRHVACRAQLTNQSGCVPCRAAGELLAFQQDHVGDADFRQMVGQ